LGDQADSLIICSTLPLPSSPIQFRHTRASFDTFDSFAANEIWVLVLVVVVVVVVVALVGHRNYHHYQRELK